MDPHPDLPYLAHLLDMARSSIRNVPSAGVCIDRQDWLGHVNPSADDHATWFPVSSRRRGGGVPTSSIPARALINSWKPAMAAFAQVWHAAGKVVIITDHSNRLDMMEHVDGIYAEMGDQVSASGLIHAVGSGLAAMNLPCYIWAHPSSDNSYPTLAAGLQAHLQAGVFPTVPVKNNDHAIGGDCAPNCPFDQIFIDYGALFVALKERRWVLDAHAVHVVENNALANIFSNRGTWIATPTHAPGASRKQGEQGEPQQQQHDRLGGVGQPTVLVAVAFAPMLGRVDLLVSGLPEQLGGCETIPTLALVQPGDQLDGSGRAVPGSYAPSSCVASGGDGSRRGCGVATITKPGGGAGSSLEVSVVFGGQTEMVGSYLNTALLVFQCIPKGSQNMH
jgi:hypothetical protein